MTSQASVLHAPAARWTGRRPALVVATLLLAGTLFGQTGAREPATERLNAVLWTQTAIEHTAACEQAYRLARIMLDRARRDRNWTAAVEQRSGYQRLPPAIILDIDETVLDNSQEEGERARFGDRPGLWDDWVKLERATALPGAVEFTRYAASHGVEVIYLSNREAAAKEATQRTLASAGFPLQHRGASIVLKGERPEWGSDKGTRREAMAKRYRILLLIGDDLNDFVSGVRTGLEERLRIAAKYSDRWGERWILLPNAMYGSWENAYYGGETVPASREEQMRLKYERLRTMK